MSIDPQPEFNSEAWRWQERAIRLGYYYEGSALGAVLQGDEWVNDIVGDMPIFEDRGIVDWRRVSELSFPVFDEERSVAQGTLLALFMTATGQDFSVSRHGIVIPATGELTGSELANSYREIMLKGTAGGTFDLSVLQYVSALRAVAKRFQHITVPEDNIPTTLTLPLNPEDEPPAGLVEEYTKKTQLTGGITMTELFKVDSTLMSNQDRVRARVVDHAPVFGEYSVDVGVSS